MFYEAKNRLREVRQSKRMTLKQIYGDICSKRHYIRLEQNHCDLNITHLCHFAHRLGVDFKELIIEPEQYIIFDSLLVD